MVMTPDQFVVEMERIKTDPNGDIEMDHSKADDLMCELLTTLGYEEGVRVFKSMKKWYS